MVNLITLNSFSAEEEGHGANPEAPKVESGEQGGKGMLTVPTDEFLDLNIAVEQLSAKIRSKNEDIRKLLVEKDHVKDPNEFKKLVDEIQKNYRELQEFGDNLEKKKAVLRYRFPEKSFVKKSLSPEVKELEEVNAETVVQERTEQLLEVVESQYQKPVRLKSLKLKKALDAGRSPATAEAQTNVGNKDETDLNNPEDFTRSLIIKK